MKYLETIKIKSISENGEIEGYASVFGEEDSYGDIVQKGAFSKSIDEFNCGKKPKLLWQHDTTEPIGVIDEIFEDDYGLFVKAHLVLDIPKAKEAYALLKNKAIDGFSIGYRIRNNYQKDNLQYLTDLDLMEISIVTFPACPSAVINSVKQTNMDENFHESNHNKNFIQEKKTQIK